MSSGSGAGGFERDPGRITKCESDTNVVEISGAPRAIVGAGQGRQADFSHQLHF